MPNSFSFQAKELFKADPEIPRARQTLWLALGFFTILIIPALFVDGALATWLRDTNYAGKLKWHPQINRIGQLLKVPGEAHLAFVAATVVLVHHRSRWAGSLMIVLASVLSGLNPLIKWMAGRKRPFKDVDMSQAQPFNFSPFPRGLKGILFGPENLSFPSGHACLAFSLAGSLTLLYPRLWWLFFLPATTCALERTGENAHYLSEAAAGAVFGIAMALVARMLTDRGLSWWRPGPASVLPVPAQS